MNLKQLFSIGIVLIPTLTYAQQVPPQDLKKSKEQLQHEKHDQEKLLEERENRLLKEKHSLEYAKIVEEATKNNLQFKYVSKEDRIKLQAEKELQENPFAVKPTHPEEKSKLFSPTQLEFKTETIDLSKGRFKVKGLDAKEEQTISFSEKEMPLHLVESFIDFAPLNKKGVLLKRRNDWIAEKIPSLLSKNTLDKSNKDLGMSLDSSTINTNIPLTDKEFIGKSGSRILVEDEIILQLDSTVWYEHVADNDSVLTRKVYQTYDEIGRKLQIIEHRKDTNGEFKIFSERNYLRDENDFLAEIEFKEIIEGTLTVTSTQKYNWVSEVEGSYEYYLYNKNTKELEPSLKREFKYVSNDNAVDQSLQYESFKEYTFNKALQTWVGRYGYSYTYDENGYTNSYRQIEWYNYLGYWRDYSLQEITNDENGNLLTSLKKYYSRTEEGLVNSRKNNYSYDEFGNQVLYEQYNWNKASQVWEGSDKYEREYNADGQLLSDINYDWGIDAMAFVADHKYDYTYFSEGLMETSVRSNWNKESNEFIPDYREAFTYENDMQTSSISEYYEKESSEWLKSYKYEYAFDTNGYRTEYRSYFGSNNEWIKYFASDFKYDGNGNFLEGVVYDVVDNEWVNSILEQNTYDSNDNKLSQAAFNYVDQEWVKVFKNEYAFDENGNQTLYANYSGIDNSWIKEFKNEYQYDSEGRQLLNNYATNDGENNWLYSSQDLYEYPSDNSSVHTYQYWSTDSGDWVNSSRYSYTSDENSYTTEEAYWSLENSVWENSWKHKYTYNENGDEVEVADYSGDGIEWNRHWLKKYKYNSNDLLTKIEEFDSADSDWAATAISSKVLEYDNEDRLTLEQRVAPDDWGLDESYKHEFEYDENGNQLLEVYRYGKSDNYVSGTKYERAYKEVDNGDYTSNYTILRADYNWSETDQAWKGNYKYEYDYDDNGNLIINSYLSDWDDEENSYGYKYHYEHDDNGNRVLYKRQNYITDSWVNSWEDRYAFDDNGNQTMVSYQYSWDTSLEYYSSGYRYHYSFNELNQVTQSVFDQFNEGEWTLSSKNEYAYDSEGRQNENIYSNWNSETSKYVLSSKQNWSYLNDLDHDYTYSYYSGNDWVISNQEEIRYNLDTFVQIGTTFNVSKDEALYEYKSWYASSDFDTQLKSKLTDFQNSDNNEMTLYERHFNQDYFRSTYNLKVSNDSLIDYYKNYLVIEDSMAGVLTSRIYYNNNGTYDKPVWVESEKYMYEFTDGIQSGIAQYSHDGTTFVPEEKYSMTYSEDKDVYTDISYEVNGSEFENYFKREFKTNDSGQTIASASYYWSSDSEMWIGNYRYDNGYTLDDEGNTYYKYASYYWDNSNNVWEGSSAYEEKSDTHGNGILFVYLNWDYDNLDWVPHYKYEYTYNDEQVMTSEISYNWSDKQQEWIGDRKRDIDGDRTAYSELKYSDNTWQYVRAHTYTTEDNISTRIEEEWVTDTWVNAEKNINTFGDVDINEYYGWSSEIANWYKYFKESYYHNEEDQYVHEIAIGVSGEWVNLERRTTLKDDYYNGEYSLSFSMYEDWINGAWMKDRIEENRYDYNNWENGYSEYYIYDSNKDEFVPDRKETRDDYTYTWNTELEDWLGIRHNISDYNHTERWDNELGKWILHEKEYYMYSPVITYDLPSAVSINETPSMEMNILTTAPGLEVVTSGASASLEDMTITFEEAGTLELTISTPAGETSYGTPYTAREIKAEMLVEKTEEALALDNVTLASELLVYPNPSSDFVKVSVSAGTIISKIDLFTISGVNKGSTFNSLIDVKGLSQGVYILRISTNKGVVSKTLVVK
ncbi:T9SS type A sorting domain-containing protein [Flammeovirga pectinis]|uniref:T9SS type A sorting domain-containing protein n=1 Tax=Flammeovirga pectinis TaxID=2494373 RepID=A0A3Q9FNR1_9BACT|nr:T9SS type A sorting domain-containing protein [Flammeovirga pectinis]AZQ63721.1 T9SS type A sorting domain-containing protein [Flammeovirga pectinis]